MIGEDFEGKNLVLEILNKDPSAVASEEIAILRARSSYLTDEEKKRYGIGGEKEEKSIKELKKEAKEKGIDIKGLKTKEEIVEAIEIGTEEEDKD